VFDDVDLFETVFAPAIANPVGERAVARRAGDVRLDGQKGMGLARAPWRRERKEPALDGALPGGGLGGETVDAPCLSANPSVPSPQKTPRTQRIIVVR